MITEPLISIVMPVLNEAQFIGNTIQVLLARAQNKSRIDVVVIDSGSTDNTVKIVEELGVKIEIKPEFLGSKYKALNYGAAVTEGEILLFLDADCLLPHNYDQLIVDALSTVNVAGGAFEYRSDDRSLPMKIIEGINHIRYRISPAFFGDQGIFCTRKKFDQIHGFPEEPIMEAAYFCQRLGETGSLKLVKKSITTSARRFIEGGVFKVMMLDTWIWLQYLLGLNISHYARGYWKENELRGHNS